MVFLFYLFIFLLSFGQLQRISLTGGTINFYLHEIVMLAFIIFLYAEGKKIRKSPLIFAGLLFVFSLFLSLSVGFWNFTFFQNLVGFFYILRLILYFSFFLSLRSLDKKIIERGLTALSFMVIFMSLIQYSMFPKLASFVSAGWDPHEYRAVGLFFDVSAAGVVFVLLLLFTLYQSFAKKKTKLERKYFVLAFIFITLILLTYSRITYLSFLSVIIFLVIYRAPLKNILLSLSIFVFLISIVPRLSSGESNNLERTFSIHSRFEDAQEGVALWQKNPIFGIGYNRISTFRNKQISSIPNHSASSFSSSFVTILAASGIVGFLAFIFFLFELYRKSSLWGRLFLVPMVVAGALDNVFFHPLVFGLFIVLILFVGDD